MCWHAELDVSVITLVRPVPWAREIGDLRFLPDDWGDQVFEITADEGRLLVVRRHDGADLSLWLPDRLAPRPGERFGLYVHPDRNHADRVEQVSLFRRAIGLGVPVRHRPDRDAARHAAMLFVHDSLAMGRSLPDIAEEVLGRLPDDWRSSSERSDLRRLAEAAEKMTGGGYRSLLRRSPRRR